MRIKNTILVISIVILSASAGYSVRRYLERSEKTRQEFYLRQVRRAAWQELGRHLKSEIDQFKGEAGIVIKDLHAGWELSYQKSKLFPSASLAKIPIMAGCFLAAEQNLIKLNRDISLKSTDKLTGSGMLKDLPAGKSFSVDRLIGFMIYDSDNTATNILTDLLGIDYLNKTFQDFGLQNTFLSRKIADYRSRDKGLENYTTAEDMVLLLEKIYRRALGNKSVSDRCLRILKLARMNDRIPKYLPPEITVAHKTGLEKGVCHDTGIVFTCSGDFIIVVLTKHADANSAPSKEFIARISLQAYKYFEQLNNYKVNLK
ncbi:MAG: serine hydrolase [Candidatus Omnitrophota bacterium]|jgi:beta-lactamase class A|nr:MAG: serine hydrolase [Candidatus Omnitrophota bacterium]